MTLKEYITHQLREMRRELLLAIEGLSDEDLTSHEAGCHSPIAWIVQHCCLNVDFFIHRRITGRFCLEHEEKWQRWPLVEPQPGDEYPSLPQLIERWSTVVGASLAALEGLTEDALQQPGTEPWCPEPLVTSCLRITNHQNAHLRQIWCVLGMRRSVKWPVQETWLA